MFIKDSTIISTSSVVNFKNLEEPIQISVTDNDNMPRNIVSVGDLELSPDGIDWSNTTIEVDFTEASMKEIFVRPTTGLESGSGTITVEEIGA